MAFIVSGTKVHPSSPLIPLQSSNRHRHRSFVVHHKQRSRTVIGMEAAHRSMAVIRAHPSRRAAAPSRRLLVLTADV